MNSAHCYAPLGDISIGIKCAPGVVGPAEADIDFDIIKNDNDTFTVKYTPPAAGRYTIMVLFAEQVKHKFQCVLKNYFYLIIMSECLKIFPPILLLTGNSHQSIQSQSGSIP